MWKRTGLRSPNPSRGAAARSWVPRLHPSPHCWIRRRLFWVVDCSVPKARCGRTWFGPTVRRRWLSWRRKFRCYRRNLVLSPRRRARRIAACTNCFRSPRARGNQIPLTDTASLVRLASRARYAVVQINTNGGTYDITRAIIESAEEERAPVILGAYEANLGYRGYEYAAMQMCFFAERASVPVAVHLDHGSTIDA